VLHGLIAFFALIGCAGWGIVTLFFTAMAREEHRGEAASTLGLFAILPVLLALGGSIAGIVLARQKRTWASLICGGVAIVIGVAPAAVVAAAW
jgi:hypothetical protein